MKEELIIKVLSKASEFLSQEDIQKLRDVMNIELYDYEVQPAVHALVPYNQSAEILKMYLAAKALDGLARGTLENYSRYLTSFLRGIGKEVQDINSMDCRVFLATYKSQGVKNSTLNTISSCLKSFFSWLINNDYIQKNPMAVIKNIKTSKYVRKALSADQLEKLRDVCRTPREIAMVEIFFSTGARLDEIYKLNKSDIDSNTKSTYVFGKGSKERKVFLSPAALLKLQNYLDTRKDDNEALFVGQRAPHKRLGRRAIQKVFAQLGERAGLHVFPHIMRHTFATLGLKHGASLAEIQWFLGHETSSTTQIYAKFDTQSLQSSHERNIA